MSRSLFVRLACGWAAVLVAATTSPALAQPAPNLQTRAGIAVESGVRIATRLDTPRRFYGPVRSTDAVRAMMAKAGMAADVQAVFDAVPADRLIAEGTYLIEEAQRTGEWREQRVRRSQPLGLTDDQASFAFAIYEGGVMAKTRGQYPAPVIALRAVREGINRPLEEGLEIEKAGIIEVIGTPITANLVSEFFDTTRLQRENGVDDRAFEHAIERSGGADRRCVVGRAPLRRIERP